MILIPSRLTLARGKTLLLLGGALCATSVCLASPYPNVTGTAKGQSHSDWYRQCSRVKPLQPPIADRPQNVSLERCNAADLYYDTQNMDAPSDDDWRKVRECAFRTNDNAVLMMLYANGAGVSTNLSLATRYACSVESEPGEMQARVAHLVRQVSSRERFDLCDDIKSGRMHGYCAAVRERQQERRRADQIATLAKTWTSKEQTGFELVSEAAHDFAQHRADYETDLSSSARRSMQIDVIAAELDQFLTDIQAFESGKLPRYSEAEFRVLDDKMNDTYQRFMNTAPGRASYLGTIRKAGVEKTQHAFLAFRDAMELFGSMKYPSAPASGLRALLTARRLRQLSELENAATGR
jgi:uncharacterized protein YecT (DUF1311 family)